LFYRYEQRWRDAVDRTREWKERRDMESDQKDQTEVDRLLAKIHKDGIGSLTPAERDFLNEASKRMRKRK
jgi:hypothetical protein